MAGPLKGYHKSGVPALHADGSCHAHCSTALCGQQHKNEEDKEQANRQCKEREECKDAGEDIVCQLRGFCSRFFHLVNMQIGRNPSTQCLFHLLRDVNSISISSTHGDEDLRNVVMAVFDCAKCLSLAQNIWQVFD